ncbi:probable F-box protein At2g36090 [Cornus florida]|uniref:probable F-box protein At2g36090 n=1 Tax=Cornus florida TaxID=4283 RepID=UPI00289E74E5|nr:probable F-box protein At2g36090 [Cornus florida]
MSTLKTPTPTATTEEGGATTFAAVHPDLLRSHILTRLDGPTLASASSASSQLHALAADDHIWTNICHSTWPSSSAPRIRHIISTFPNGGRSFFADSFPLALPDPTTNSPSNLHPPSPSPSSSSSPELISAVDIHYQNKLIFTKVQETETLTGWFLCSPFRIDLLDPKDMVHTAIKHPKGDDMCTDLAEEMSLSWIVIDPITRRSMNLSSYKPVSVQRHWLSGEVQVRFASILAGDKKGSASELVQCGIVVTCGASEEGEMQVREVNLQVDDMDGMFLTGKESLVILQRALEGKRGKGGRKREEEGRGIYQEYLERKRERGERKLRTEGTLDTLCVGFGLSIFALFCFFVLCR